MPIRPKIFQSYQKEYPCTLATVIETQTEWSWISDVKMLAKLKEGI
jgi:hypothetical protein